MFKGQKTLAALAYLCCSLHLFMRLMKDPVKFTLKVKLLKHRVKYIRMILIKRLNSVR